MTEQPRIVTWCAVSSEEQAERESLDHQARLNREHVARWGGVVIADLVIPGMSRNIVLWEDACEEIPEFAQLDTLIKRKAFDMLMCYDVTRLGRDRALVITTARLCERAGIRIYETTSPPTNLDGPISTPDTRLLMTLKGHMSEEEVRKFNERSLFGRQAQARKGKHPGVPPTGLKKVFDADGETKVVHDEETVNLVKLFYDLYLNHGMSLRHAAIEFNARGYVKPQTGGKWEQAGMARFLINRWAYAGYVTWGRYGRNPEKAFRVKGEWEPIITEEMVYLAEAEMKKRSNGPRGAGSPRLFSFICRCGYCNATVSIKGVEGKPRKNATHKFTSYMCNAMFACRGTFIREPILRRAIEDTILLLQDDAQLNRLVGERPQDNNGLAQQIEMSRSHLEEVNKERAKLTRAYMRDTIEVEEYEPLMAELKERQAQLAHAITELEDQLAQTPTIEKRRSQLEDIRDNGMAMLNHEDMRTANAWLRRHFVIYVKNNAVERVHLY
jgi:DNA invertase Pin-like site-specific DNA recombinase